MKKSSSKQPTKPSKYFDLKFFSLFISAPVGPSLDFRAHLSKFIILLFLSSCSYFTGIVTKNTTEVEVPPNIDENKNESSATCEGPELQKLQILGGTKEAQDIFYKLLKSIESSGIILNFKDKLVIWTLLQININPVLSSPRARLQIAYQKDQKINFLDVSASPKAVDSYPIIFGLEEWLRTTKSDPSLVHRWVKYLQQNFKDQFYVNDELAQFFRQFKSHIKAEPSLRKYYFHGDDVLSKGEKLPPAPWGEIQRVYQNLNSPDNYQVIKHLLPYPKNPFDAISCNYDFDLYDRSVYGIDRSTIKGQSFGLIQGLEGFMAMTIQTPQIKSINDTPLFHGSSSIRGGVFCFLKSKTSSDSLWVLSQDSRDPGQHIHQLITKGFKSDYSREEISSSLNRMRHLFLFKPLRLIVETKKAQKSELDQLLKLDVPIYHSDQLGLIWTMKNSGTNKSQFILDPRHPGFLNCKK